MTDDELDKIILILDTTWGGGLDGEREEGYRWVLGTLDSQLVLRAVTEFAHGQHRQPQEIKWLPRAPEIAARVHQLEREAATEARMQTLLAHLERRELEATRRLELAAGDG